jgi:hypothetical protein
MRKADCFKAVLLVIGAGAAPLSAQQLAKPVITRLPGGITQVMNPGPTAWADTNGWKLVLETTIQPPAGSPGELDTPNQALVTSTGAIVVADRRTPSIKLYDRTGGYVRNVGRDGEGPAEYRMPQIALGADTLVVQDPPQRRVELMTLDGHFVRQFPGAGYCTSGPEVNDRGQILLACTGRDNAWNIFDPLGHLIDSIAVEPTPASSSWTVAVTGGVARYSIPFAPIGVTVPLRDGNVIYGTTDRYLLSVGRSIHDTTVLFGRSHVMPAPIPAEVRDSEFSMSQRNPALHSISESSLPRTYALWSNVAEDADGNFWILADGRYRGDTRFDVFTRQGVFLGSVAAPFRRPATIQVQGTHVSVIDMDQDDLPRIRIYRIDSRGH